MKQASLCTLAAALLLTSSCKKKDDSQSSSSGDKMEYSVNNVQDVFTKQFSDTTFYLSLSTENLNGIQEPVTIKLSGLPSTVVVSPDSLRGIPSFDGAFKLNGYFPEVKSIPITVTSTGEKSGTKSLEFNLNVSTNTGCASSIAGAYNETSNCNTDPSAKYTRYVSRLPTSDNVVTIQTGGAAPRVTVNCTNGTFSVMKDTTYINPLGYSELTGDGTFDGRHITLNLHYKSIGSGETMDCQSSYERQ